MASCHSIIKKLAEFFSGFLVIIIILLRIIKCSVGICVDIQLPLEINFKIVISYQNCSEKN